MKRDNTPHIQVPSPNETARSATDPEIERTVRIGETVRLEPDESAPGAPRPAAEDLASQYAVLDKIGDGGMGVVYLARDRRLGRFVAIKRLTRAMQAVPALRHRFLHEARAVAALNHIHIVHIYALGEDEGGPYIVMEYVAGPGEEPALPNRARERPNPPRTLDRQIASGGQLSVTEAIDLLIKIGKAVAYAHTCGIIHRDLKPSNILLDAAGEPKIVDFGLARLMHSEESKLTVPGEKLLSLGYGAPEQEQDASLSDERADVYGLGALLYFAITGQNPRYFREQDIPVPLREALVKALATDREQRWPSANDFTEALRAVQSRTRIETPTVKTTWRCKWCDTVNPLSIHYCADCGWDGGETCPECGAESFVGVQYCGACGADARAYEGVQGLLRRTQAGLVANQYERAISFAARTHGFEPAGPTGRKLLKDTHDLRERAERAISRRDALRELIPQELRAENYERARVFIRELRSLSGNPHLFDDEEKQLPQRTLRRDLQRARRAIRNQEWDYATRVVEDLLRDVAPEDPECLALRRRLLRHRWLVRGARVGLVLFGMLAIYTLGVVPVLQAVRSPPAPWLRRAVQPGVWLHTSSGLAAPLTTYARWWGETNLTARLAEPSAGPPGPDSERPLELQQFQRLYTVQLATLGNEQRRYAEAWPAEYLRELDALMERRRLAGDFDAWSVAKSEREQFEQARRIGESPAGEYGELAALKQKFRQLRAASRIDQGRRLINISKKFVNDLSDLQRAYTKEGRMADAARVNQEIRRVRASPELQEAEAVLADYVPPGAGDPANVLPIEPDERVADITGLRQQFDQQLAAVEDDYARNIDKWPDKYLAALKQAMEQFQAAGDYSGWDSAKTELERFEVDRAIQAKDVVNGPARLAELQKQHLDLLTQYRATRARGIVNLADSQIDKLSEYQRKYTKSGDMDSAGQVNAEMRRIRARPELLAAQAELAPPPTTTNAVPNSVR